MNHSLGDSDRKATTPEEFGLEDENWEIPANEWVPLIERDGAESMDADRGIGFLRGTFLEGPRPSEEVVFENDNEEEIALEEDTTRMGAIITNVSAQEETAIYKALHKYYRFRYRPTIGDVFAIPLLAWVLISGYSLDGWQLIAAQGIALSVAIVYLIQER